MFVAALGFFSCQKDDIDNSDSTTFELKLDKNGMISSPKWLAVKVDSIAHLMEKVFYPDVLKITAGNDFYICINNPSGIFNSLLSLSRDKANFKYNFSSPIMHFYSEIVLSNFYFLKKLYFFGFL
jgi:hypothetical protein